MKQLPISYDYIDLQARGFTSTLLKIDTEQMCSPWYASRGYVSDSVS